jgi:hypothetical protein
MWIPNDSEELERLIKDRVLEESANLDFKSELPSSSKELAKDVAAMANDGGTLVFGVGEDSSGHPTVLLPFRLAGAAERISSIIQSALAEPPTVEIKTLASQQDPEIGYLAVVVPASPRAPHMVIVKGDNRFYGRAAKGNMPLSEGEVARLYQRRQQWEQNREAHLSQVVTELALEPSPDHGFLYMFARPVAPSPNRLAALGDRHDQRNGLYQMIADVAGEAVYPHRFSPGFSGGNFKPIAAGWRVLMTGERSGSDPHQNTLELEVHFNGELRLVLGRAAQLLNGQLVLFEVGLAETVVRFLTLAGRLYRKLGYFGAVDIGLAVTGISGAVAYGVLRGHVGFLTQFDQSSFQETARVVSVQLENESSGVAHTLLGRLFHASGAVGDFDPFKNSG